MAGKGRQDGRSVSTGRIAVGKVVLDVGAPAGTTVRAVRVRAAPPPPELVAALRAERPPPAQVVEEAVETAEKVTGEVDHAARLFTRVVRGELDAATIAGELERLVGLLARLDRAGRYAEVLRLARVLSRLLTLAASWVALVETLRVAARAARELKDSEALAWVLHELGTLAFGAEDAQAATADLEEARRLRAQLGDRAGLAATDRNLRALRRPYAPQATRAGAALVLGVVAALVVAGGIDPDPEPEVTTAGQTITVQTTAPPPPPPPPPPPADETAPQPTLRLARPGGGPTNDPMPGFTGRAGTAVGDRRRVVVRIHRAAPGASEPLQERAADVGGDGSYTVRATALPSGTYTAQAEQRDEAGNTGTSDEVTFTVDVDPPRLTIASPLNGTTTDESPQFSGTAGRAEGDADVVTLTLTSQAGAIEIPVGPGGRWTRTVTVQSVFEDPGYRTFRATVTQSDAAGNSTSATVSFTPQPVVE